MDAPSRYRLRWVGADGAVAERELSQGWLTIGSAHACDLVLPYRMISRQHARVHVDGDLVEIHDLPGSKGTFVNHERVASADLSAFDEISLGGFSLHLIAAGLDETSAAEISVDATMQLALEALSAPAQQAGAVALEELLKQPVISEKELGAAGVEVKVAEYAALGGGLGSFVWVDLLRNSGVPRSDIVVIGNNQHPQDRYERLCINSQIPSHERLRSNSESCPDNFWGFPGYAVRETWRELRRGHLKGAAAILWSIFGEPAFAPSYTPRSGDVFRAIERETQRIGWPDMLRLSRVVAIRKSEEGRLLAFASGSGEGLEGLFVVSARFVHLAIGYPAIRLLPELANYREKWWDKFRVVNAYEPHEHVYAHLREHGGTVLIRGRGIVASRIIQRLFETRRENENVVIVHLHRSQKTVGHRYVLSRREIEAQFEFQPFNWPKSCWSGEQRGALESANNDERKQLLEVWEGTTTAKRHDWRRIINEGTREGWYRPEFGTVSEVRPTDDGRVDSRISSILSGGGTLHLITDFVIDCTGAVSSPVRSPLMADLIETYSLPRNKLRRLQVKDDFEVERLRHGQARLYAAGVTTLGGPYAAVDSFLGLQYAALRSIDSMYRLRPEGLRRLNGLYSFWQWTKWARGTTP